MERHSVLTVNCPRCGHPTDGRIEFDKIECAECGAAIGVWDDDAGYYRFTSAPTGNPMLVEEDQDG